MSRAPVRILGIDTSLRSTGVAVVESLGSALRAIDYGLIRNPPARSHSASLAHLHAELGGWIERHRPEVAAVEGIFFCRNVRTAMTLGEARGVALAACAARGLAVHEYAPREAKRALTGNGGATKDQVARMVKLLLALREDPPEDAADALALAVCHAQAGTGRRLGLAKIV